MKLETLTPEAFAPYGKVIAFVEEARPVGVKGGLESKESTVEAGDNRRSYISYREELIQSVRGDQDFATHNVDYDYEKELGLVFEPDLADAHS